jgi:hypothetical protein
MLSSIGPVSSKTIRKLNNQRRSSTNSYPPIPVGYTGKPDELRRWIATFMLLIVELLRRGK